MLSLSDVLTSTRFNPEKDLAPVPFDKEICHRAMDMKIGFIVLVILLARVDSFRPGPTFAVGP